MAGLSLWRSGIASGLIAVSIAAGQGTPPVRILTRDVDKRPLARVERGKLSVAMRRAVSELFTTGYPPDRVEVYAIPVAPHGHHLYLVEQVGRNVCAASGNCSETVFDEGPRGVETVVDDSGVAVLVVRRPALAMPDIAFVSQLGHFGTQTTVYRFDGEGWHAIACKEVSPIGEDPEPGVVANQPCAN